MADRAGLEAAAGTLLAYHLGGRQTDDALLGEIQDASEDYEAHGEQRKEQMLEDERRLWHNLAQQLTRLGADDERALRYATAPTASAPRRARSR